MSNSVLSWNAHQQSVDAAVDVHLTDDEVHLTVDGVRYAVPATYRTEESVTTADNGHQVFGLREYISVNNKYVPPVRVKDRTTVERLDTTGACPLIRYYRVVATDRLRMGRTKLILQQTLQVEQKPVYARHSASEVTTAKPEPAVRWTAE